MLGVFSFVSAVKPSENGKEALPVLQRMEYLFALAGVREAVIETVPPAVTLTSSGRVKAVV